MQPVQGGQVLREGVPAEALSEDERQGFYLLRPLSTLSLLACEYAGLAISLFLWTSSTHTHELAWNL